jgi:putative transposase
VRYVDDRYHRTGTLWEGRYKAGLVGDDRYLLHCHRYIELNPVSARMVAHPADYPWSSHRHHAFGTFDPIVSNHPAVTRLDHDPVERRQRDRALVLETVTPEEPMPFACTCNASISMARIGSAGRSRHNWGAR